MNLFEPTEVSDSTRVARVTQGVIAYVDGDLRSIWDQVHAAWRYLVHQPWASQLSRLRRWNEPRWQPWDPTQIPSFLSDLQQRGPRQEYWKVELCDEPSLPQVGIDCQDVELTQGQFPRASFLRVRLPLDTRSDDLLTLTSQLVDLLPVQQARAGYLCHIDDVERSLGFDQAWVWARRFYGLDIVDPVEQTWDATEGIYGVNWLTVLGKRWLDKELAAIDFDHVPPPVRVLRQKQGIILQAGAAPSTGDQNLFEDVGAYTEVTRLIEPALVKSPTAFPGMFTDHESTELWLRRFLDPTAWRDAS
jgi:hypothetical protein